MLTVRKLYDMEKCYKKGDFSFLNSAGNRSFTTAIFIKSLLEEHGLIFDREILEEMIDETFKSGFINKKEEDFFKNSLINRLLRFKTYLETNDYEFKEKPGAKLITLGKESIRANYDLILQKGDTIFVARVKNSKPSLKLRGHLDETAVNKSIELYSLYETGKQLFPGKEIEGAIFHLTNEKDSSSNYKDLGEFEFKKGKNIISYSFEEKSDIENVKKRLKKILDNDTCGDCKDCYYNSLCNFVNNPKKEIKKEDKSVTSKKVSLTDSQEILTDFKNGVARVSAIPGSGKSTTLGNRFATLVEGGTNPSSILGLTFTIQGVIELKEKIKYWADVKGLDCKGINVFTFNEFCYNLVKDNYKKLGFSEVPKILAKLEKTKIISDLLDKNKTMNSLNYSNPLMDFHKAKGAIFRCIELIESIDFGEPLGVLEVSEITRLNEYDSEILLDIFYEYKDILKKNNYITLENQIELGSTLLKPAMVDTLGYEHIIVDEAQDTNIPQLNIILKLRKYSNFKSLVICGDEAQAIYGWRGADNKILVELKKYLPDLFDIKLEDNFRSTKEICSLANNLNNLNTYKINKKMIAHKNGKKPALILNDIVGIANEIKNLIDNGEALKDIAFIARNKKELEKMQMELKKLNIPANVIVSELLIENMYFNNVADLANFFVNTELTLNLSNYLNMIKGNKLSKAKDLEEFINDEKEAFINKLDSLSNEEKFNYYIKLISELIEESSAIKSFIHLIEEKNFKEINQLVVYINELRDFKSDIVIENDSLNDNSVNLITAHSSKGKEYKNVLISLDSFKLKSKCSDIDEERRCLFVAITRAKETLKLFYKNDKHWSDEIEHCLKIS